MAWWKTKGDVAFIRLGADLYGVKQNASFLTRCFQITHVNLVSVIYHICAYILQTFFNRQTCCGVLEKVGGRKEEEEGEQGLLGILGQDRLEQFGGLGRALPFAHAPACALARVGAGENFCLPLAACSLQTFFPTTPSSIPCP